VGDHVGPDTASSATDSSWDAASGSPPPHCRTVSNATLSSADQDAEEAQPGPASAAAPEPSPEFFEQQSARIMAAIAGTQLCFTSITTFCK